MTRLALVGTGAWGKNYIRTIRSMAGCELPSDAIKTRDYKDLLVRSDIDGVIIATPAATHVGIAKDFLEAGFPVLIEKPLGTSYKEAVALARMAKKRGIPAMVGHIFVYHPAVHAIQKEMHTAGKIQYILAESMDKGPVRSDISALWDWGPHDISVALYLLGAEPRFVYGWDMGGGMCVVRLTFPGAVEFISTMGWASPVKKRIMTIVGKNRSFFFDDMAQSLTADKLPLNLEVKEFVTCIRTKRVPKTPLEDGVVVVKILEALEKSMRSHGKRIYL